MQSTADENHQIKQANASEHEISTTPNPSPTLIKKKKPKTKPAVGASSETLPGLGGSTKNSEISSSKAMDSKIAVDPGPSSNARVVSPTAGGRKSVNASSSIRNETENLNNFTFSSSSSSPGDKTPMVVVSKCSDGARSSDMVLGDDDVVTKLSRLQYSGGGSTTTATPGSGSPSVVENLFESSSDCPPTDGAVSGGSHAVMGLSGFVEAMTRMDNTKDLIDAADLRSDVISQCAGHNRKCEPPATLLEVMSKNKKRQLRFSQNELNLIGQHRIQTKIEVIEMRKLPSATKKATGVDDDVMSQVNENSSSSVVVVPPLPAEEASLPFCIFSVKHVHDFSWPKQVVIHKNLMVACMFADVKCPVVIPDESIHMFKCTENTQHVHLYLERLVSHLKFHSMPEYVSVFWWRAVEPGALVFQNWKSGKLIIIRNHGKSIPAAVETIKKGLDMMGNLPKVFFEPDSNYDRLNTMPVPRDSIEFSSAEEVSSKVQEWALEDNVSPWLTKLIIKSRSTKRLSLISHHRYSLGVEVISDPPPPPGIPPSNFTNPPVVAITIQVHLNEPLSRELRAFPVCQVPVLLDSWKEHETVVAYLRSMWFLRKLFDFHYKSEETRLRQIQRERTEAKKDKDMIEGKVRGMSIGHRSRHCGSSAGGKVSDDSDIESQPADLNYKMVLMGGARLAEYPDGRKRIRVVNTARPDKTRLRSHT